jgi:tripartite-type tricarboxylate transporter receptor subunit TctC
VPAINESLPGFVSVFWTGLGAPPGTPMPIVEKISAAVADALKQPDVAQRLREQNVEAVGSTPAEAAAFWAQERERWGKVIRATGAKAD